MLILSRRVGESIIIGDEVNITILSIKGKQVRVGIAAPDSISVHREEIYNKICAENGSDSAQDRSSDRNSDNDSGGDSADDGGSNQSGSDT